MSILVFIRFQESVLHYAAEGGDSKTIELLLSDSRIDINYIPKNSSYQSSVIGRAFGKQNANAVILLLEDSRLDKTHFVLILFFRIRITMKLIFPKDALLERLQYTNNFLLIQAVLTDPRVQISKGKAVCRLCWIKIEYL